MPTNEMSQNDPPRSGTRQYAIFLLSPSCLSLMWCGVVEVVICLSFKNDVHAREEGGRPPHPLATSKKRDDDKLSLGVDYVLLVIEGELMGFVVVREMQHKLLLPQ